MHWLMGTLFITKHVSFLIRLIMFQPSLNTVLGPENPNIRELVVDVAFLPVFYVLFCWSELSTTTGSGFFPTVFV